MALAFNLRTTSYAAPIVISVAIHAILVVFVVWGWESAEPPKRVVAPRYVEAKLVTIEPKSKKPQAAKKKPKVVDLTAKREAQKKRDAALKKKRLADQKAERERLRKLAQEKQRKLDAEEKAALAKAETARLERERLAAEQQRNQESAFADALAQEDELLLAQEDAATAQGFVALMARRIENNWSRPPSARRGMKCELQIQLVPTGEVVNVSIVKSSGNSAFDRSAQQAVNKVGRFSELKDVPPELFEQYFRQLTLIFNPQDLRL